MSRTLIGGIVAAVILILTAVAYFVTTSSLEQQIRTEIDSRVQRAEQQLIQNASLEGLGLLKRVEALAADQELSRALRAEGKQRSQMANLAFQRFVQSLGPGQPAPDIVALTDAKGDLVVQQGVSNPLPSKWKDKDDQLEFPGLELALTERHIIADVWNFKKEGLMNVGVAPIVDLESDVVIGALVVAYSTTSKNAREQAALLGADVAYFHKDSVYATSFTRPTGEEDTEMQAKLAPVLARDNLGQEALSKGVAQIVVTAMISEREYLATAGRMPRFSSKPLPASYPATLSGAMVMMSLSDALDPLASIKTSILLLGLAAFVLAVLANIITARRILAQADAIEDAINDVTQGNLDRTIRAVGAELDGLAHALNVMLARLLGRPEPGDEQFDEDGNLIQSAQVNFDNDELSNLSPADPATMALAQEPEPEYYNRLFNEYIRAREQVGDSIANINYENFITKLRLNEGNLKVKYQCSAVRFKVVVSGQKVTLKPVPIV
ncbi:MAG: MXAN_5187 C-terminal domain-containing protein [Myxococcota bacterium]